MQDFYHRQKVCLRALDAHRHADVRLVQRRGVVDAVACPHVLQGFRVSGLGLRVKSKLCYRRVPIFRKLESESASWVLRYVLTAAAIENSPRCPTNTAQPARKCRNLSGLLPQSPKNRPLPSAPTPSSIRWPRSGRPKLSSTSPKS